MKCGLSERGMQKPWTDCQALVIYCTHFDALYRRKMLEDTWSKIAIVEFL